MYKLTIAVATYNRANMLTQMLDSILQQTYTDFYVIIYDNCSEDNTTEAVKPYLSDARFSYHRHSSMVNNFNYAIKYCKTDYLIIVHDDDIMLPDMIKEEISIMDSYNDVSIVSTNMNTVSNDGKTIIGPHVNKNFENCFINSREYINILINKANIIACPTAMFRMSVMRDYDFKFRSDIGGGADLYLWLELNQINYKFYYINKELYNYRIHESQDSVLTPFLTSLLRKPVYFLLVKHAYSKYIVKKWLHFVDYNFLEELDKQKNKKIAFNKVKENIFFKDNKDFFLLIGIYNILYGISFIKVGKLIKNIIKKTIPENIYQYLKKLYHNKKS
jgi:glycosyltransferase involved in cell wall biosynthesis